MSRSATVRWVRGLIPALVLFVLLIISLATIWLSVVGVPEYFIQKIEEEIAQRKYYVKIGGLRVNFISGFIFKLTDVKVFLNPEKTKDFLSADRVQINAEVDSLGDLLEGNFKLTRVSTRNVNVEVLVDPKQENGACLKLTNFSANILLGFDEMLSIQKAEGFLQGMPFSVSGNYRLPKGEEKNQDRAEQMMQFRKTAQHISDILQQLHWDQNSPPRWEIQLNEDSQEKLRFDVLLQSAWIQYQSIRVKALDVDLTLQDDLLIINHLQFINKSKTGSCKLVGSIDLSTQKVECTLDSSLPLLSWANSLVPKPFLPKELVLLADPHVELRLSLHLDSTWEKVQDFSFMGSLQSKEFMLCGEKFRRCSMDFSCMRGKLLISDFQIVHEKGLITASLLGEQGDLQAKLHSSLPIPAVLGVINGLIEQPIKIPAELSLQGIPEIDATAYLVASRPFIDVINDQGKGGKFDIKLKKSSLKLVLEDFAVRDVAIGKISLDASTEGNTFNLYDLSLSRPDGSFHCEGMWADNTLVFKAENSFPVELWLQALEGYVHLPNGLGAPHKADFKAFGRLAIGLDIPASLLELNLETLLKDFKYNGVALDSAEIKGRYTNVGCLGAKARLETFLVKKGNQELSLFAAGDWLGEMSCAGMSSFSLSNIDKLLDSKEAAFFFNRFKCTDKSALKVEFSAGLTLSKPMETLNVKLQADIAHTTYADVLVTSANTKGEATPEGLVLTEVVMNLDNSSYTRTLPGKGERSGVLKSSQISFDFTRNTVKVDKLQATVYPAYALRMFSPKAAEALEPFKFEKMVTITGSGVFPLADDFSAMTSRIHFSMRGGKIAYPLLGTKLMMSRCSGDILISPVWAKVQELTGLIWGGSFSGGIDAQIDRGNAINGHFRAFGLNLSDIGKSYTTELSPAQVDASIEFTSKNGNLKSIKGKGGVFLQKGNLVEFPLFGEIGNLLSTVIPGLSHLINFNIQESSATYEIEDGYIKTNDFKGSGTNMSLSGTGWMNLGTTNVDMNLRMKLRGVTGVLTMPVFLVAGSLFEFEGKGPLDKTTWSMRPFSRKSQKKVKL